MRIDICLQSTNWNHVTFTSFPTSTSHSFPHGQTDHTGDFGQQFTWHETQNMRASSCPCICSRELVRKGRLLRFSLCVSFAPELIGAEETTDV